MKASVAGTQFEVLVVFNGVERPLEVNGHAAMQAVLEHAENLFEITQNRHLLGLYDEENHEFVDLSLSAEDSGLHAGMRLVLRQSEVRGG